MGARGAARRVDSTDALLEAEERFVDVRTLGARVAVGVARPLRIRYRITYTIVKINELT